VSNEDMVLGVRGLSLDMIPKGTLQDALVKHFLRHTGYKAECEIIDGIGRLTFEHPEGLLNRVYFCLCKCVNF
jgi:hypothetical protein